MHALQSVTSATVIAMSVAIAAAPGFAHAQQKNFPSKPIRLVVPFSPGGTSDVVARMIGSKMSESWGQPVVVEKGEAVAVRASCAVDRRSSTCLVPSAGARAPKAMKLTVVYGARRLSASR